MNATLLNIPEKYVSDKIINYYQAYKDNKLINFKKTN